MIQVNVKKLHPNAIVPAYMTEHAAGMDLCTVIEEPAVLEPGERTLLPTGLAMEIPPGYEGQVRPRSGLALKHGIGVLNGPGTIDADYRGEVGIILFNFSGEDFEIRRGDRIAQLVISRVSQLKWEAVEQLPESDRGEGGFGHRAEAGGEHVMGPDQRANGGDRDRRVGDELVAEDRLA